MTIYLRKESKEFKSIILYLDKIPLFSYQVCADDIHCSKPTFFITCSNKQLFENNFYTDFSFAENSALSLARQEGRSLANKMSMTLVDTTLN
jgi:hypothetical protein